MNTRNLPCKCGSKKKYKKCCLLQEEKEKREARYLPPPPSATQLKCVWCSKTTTTIPCEHCKSEHVVNPRLPHPSDWSRYTMNHLQCKVCERIIKNEEQLDIHECHPIEPTKLKKSLLHNKSKLHVASMIAAILYSRH